jgi:DNA-binding HxlR family transcriptional regulator
MKPAHIAETEDCRRISEMLSRIGDKWSVLVVVYLGEESRRFSELRRMIGGISQKMLTVTLRKLERDGFVSRTIHPTRPPSVDYRLTELGRELLVPVAGIADWTRANMRRIDEARRQYDRQPEKLELQVQQLGK